MSTVNLYDVLNLEKSCSRKDIKSAYRKLAKEFHPDKPGGDAEMFELITHAYNILIDKQSRDDYDELYKLTKQATTDHVSLRDQSTDYMKAQGTSVTKKSKSDAKREFKKAWEDMDRKHSYSREKDDKPIGKKDASKMMRDLELAREQEDLENIHENIFEGGSFNLDKFNAAFDALHKGTTDLIEHDGNPAAFNTIGGLDGSFSAIDNYEDLYAEDDNNFGAQYSSVNFDTRTKKKRLTAQDMSGIKGASYVKGHSEIDKDYNTLLEERMLERTQETNRYDDREMEDFDDDPTCGGYGIFSDLGIKNIGALQWENGNDDDLKERYNRLLEMRKNDP